MKYLWIGVCLSDEQREFIIQGGGKIPHENSYKMQTQQADERIFLDLAL